MELRIVIRHIFWGDWIEKLSKPPLLNQISIMYLESGLVNFGFLLILAMVTSFSKIKFCS